MAGMIASKYRILLRPVLRDYGGQVAPAYAKASAGKHGAWRKDHFEERCA
jgi:hypothetical protein